MRRINRRTALLIAAVGAVLLLAACGSPKPTTPNVAKVQATALGASLKAYGYTPVRLMYSGKRVTTLYVVCSSGNLTSCAHLYATLPTKRRPDIYAVNGKITQLQGPASSAKGGRSPYVNIPVSWSVFNKLSAANRHHLLAIMSSVDKALASGVIGQTSTILVPYIGQTTANWRIAPAIP